ncbi:MAG: iron-containing alcohol dehydrogenase [Clostridia bacterium]|nr:iron-containing alcohol dehydrogenase [Clostridia bacterium]
MRHYNNYMPVEIISGKDCVKNFEKYKKLGNKCFIVTGKNVSRCCEVINHLTAVLDKQDIEYEIFKDVENNPSVETVIKAAALAINFGAEFIIGAGGGSPMDAAKAIALVCANNVTAEDIFTNKYENKPLPLILIGTTAGTGSEVTAAAVLTTVSNGTLIKKTLKTSNSYADYALCDPQYTCSLPAKVTVSTALDSISHAIEAYFSKKGGQFARVYAIEALQTVMPALDAFITDNNNDEQVREKLLYGSIMAGMAINNGGTSFPHTLGYVLTTMHNIPHGVACAIFIGEFLKRVDKVESVNEVIKAAGEKSIDDFSNKLRKWASICCDIPELTEKELQVFCDIGIQMPNIENSIILHVTRNDCEEIYKNVCGLK